MAAGDLIDGDFQLEWKGLRLGGPGDVGIRGMGGLADTPDVITADRDRLRAHGLNPGDDFMVGRTVTAALQLDGASIEAVRQAQYTLARTAVPGDPESLLVFQIPGVADGVKARISCRLRAKKVPMELGYEVGIVTSDLLWEATDPRIYDAVDTVQSALLPSGGGGLDVAVQLPADLSAQVESGSLMVTNAGNFSSPWSARIDGPVTNPVIRNVTTGQFVGFNITLADGEWLDLDTNGARTVTLNGSTSRYYTIAAGSSWWDMEPGVTELAFRASTPTAALLTVTSRSAWTS